jgi:hypothetical protein
MGPDYDDYIMEEHEKYSFDQCKQYQSEDADDEDVEYVLKCEASQLEVHPIQDEDQVGVLLKSVQLMQEDEFETVMMKDFKKFVMSKLQANYDKLDADNLCFSERAPASCANKVQSLTALVKQQYPKMRQNLALKESLGFRVNMEHDLNDPEFLDNVERDIEHPYHDTNIPKLSHEESRTAIKSYWEQRGSYIDNYFEKNTSYSHNSCKAFNENTMQTTISRKTRYCRDRLGTRISTGFNKERVETHKKGYEQQVSSMPFLPYMTLGDISNTPDSLLQANIKQAYGKIANESKSKIDEMNRWPLDKFKDLFRYQGLVEEYLKEKNPPPRFLCDVVENVHDWHGDGGWWSIAGDVGLGAAALLGGGVCFFTAGLGCAIGVGIVSVAADLGRTQLDINQATDDYRGGIALTNDIEEAETDRAFALAFAPLSFIGLQTGKGFKPAVRQIAQSAKNVRASADNIANFLTRLGSKGKRNLIKAKKLYGATDVSMVIAMVSKSPADLQLQVKQILNDPDMINSQAFEE